MLLSNRCGIPVVVMGETGCGKTHLIRYMCGLQAGPNGPRNMLLMKVRTTIVIIVIVIIIIIIIIIILFRCHNLQSS